MADDDQTPRLKFVEPGDAPFIEVIAQMHGDRRVCANNKYLEWTPTQMVAQTRYDPGLVIERHGHASNHFIYILEGELDVGDRHCPTGTLIVLDKGAVFGPLIAGPNGTSLLEVWLGDPLPMPADKEGYYALLKERGIERLAPPKFERPANAPKRRDGGPDYG